MNQEWHSITQATDAANVRFNDIVSKRQRQISTLLPYHLQLCNNLVTLGRFVDTRRQRPTEKEKNLLKQFVLQWDEATPLSPDLYDGVDMIKMMAAHGQLGHVTPQWLEKWQEIMKPLISNMSLPDIAEVSGAFERLGQPLPWWLDEQCSWKHVRALRRSPESGFPAIPAR